jgi:hypothetical protein
MKCLTYLLVLIILIQVIVNVSSLSTFKKVENVKSNNLSLAKRNLSQNPLPPHWTTEHRSNIAFQIGKKHVAYNKRLASVHRYRDATRHLMKQSLKAK